MSATGPGQPGPYGPPPGGPHNPPPGGPSPEQPGGQPYGPPSGYVPPHQAPGHGPGAYAPKPYAPAPGAAPAPGQPPGQPPGQQGPAGPYPPPPGYPAGPPPSGSSNRGGLIALVVGVVVLAVLTTVGIVYYLNRDDDTVAADTEDSKGDSEDKGDDRGNDDGDGGGDEPAAEPWTLARDTVPKYLNSEATWLTDEAIVHVAETVVIAVDPQTGEVLWQHSAPAPEGGSGESRFCGSSRTVVDGKVALAYGAGLENDATACQVLEVLDVTSGEEVWSAVVAEPHHFAGEFPDDIFVDIVGGVVLAGWHVNFDAVALGYDLEAGTEQWRLNATKQIFDRDACSITDLAPYDDTALVVGSCLGFDADFADELAVVRLNPADGSVVQSKLTSETDIGFDFGNLKIFTTDPLVLRVINSEFTGMTGDSLMSIDPSTLAITTVIGEKEGRALWAVTQVESSHVTPTAVADSAGGWVAAITVRSELGSPSSTPAELDAKLVAYDLTSGKPLWTTQPDGVVICALLAVEDGKLIAWGTDESGQHVLLTMDGSSGDLVGDPAPIAGSEEFHIGPFGLRPEVRAFVTGDWVFAARVASGYDTPIMLGAPR